MTRTDPRGVNRFGESYALRTMRTRWRRWLGQKTRIDQPYWTTLLDSFWIQWPSQVLDEHDLEYKPITWLTPREEVKQIFLEAIDVATFDELRSLDALYAEDRWLKP